MKSVGDLSREIEIPASKLEEAASLGNALYFYKRMRFGNKVRVLRCAKEPLATIQVTIKRKLLDRLPLPPTMHGWRKRHSAKTYAAEHVVGFWTAIGYDNEAAKLLTRLTTCDNQLPQGASTSPSLGNQVLTPINRRVGGLSRQHRLHYGNFADEVTVSGRPRAERLKGLVMKIINQEGFAVNPDEVKVQASHERQELAGMVVNKKLSLGRDRYRRLRAIIHNCIKTDPDSQKREGIPHFKEHLRGKIAQLQHISPRLGKNLLSAFNKIVWS